MLELKRFLVASIPRRCHNWHADCSFPKSKSRGMIGGAICYGLAVTF